MFRKSIALTLLSAFFAMDAPANEPPVESNERTNQQTAQSTEPQLDYSAENLMIQLEARRRFGRHQH